MNTREVSSDPKQPLSFSGKIFKQKKRKYFVASRYVRGMTLLKHKMLNPQKST